MLPIAIHRIALVTQADLAPAALPSGSLTSPTHHVQQGGEEVHGSTCKSSSITGINRQYAIYVCMASTLVYMYILLVVCVYIYVCVYSYGYINIYILGVLDKMSCGLGWNLSAYVISLIGIETRMSFISSYSYWLLANSY